MRRRLPLWARAAALSLAASLAPLPGAAQSARNVLVIVDAGNPDSVEIGRYYASARQVPADQVIELRLRQAVTSSSGAAPARVPDEMPRLAYDRLVESPIAQWLLRNGAADRILYIVLTKGIPLRIAGTSGREGTQSSVDSELTLLYRRMTGQSVAPGGSVANPYYADETKGEAAGPFTHERHDIFLVTRLDGFTVADVKALIDRGLSPRNEGRVVLDMKMPRSEPGNAWLVAAADRLTAMGLGERVTLEQTSDVVKGGEPVLGHFSWGSGDPTVRQRRTGLSFTPGAIAASFESTAARTFTEPPAAWTLGTWERRESWYSGSPQSLIGDFVREGVTGMAGYVAEPFLDRTIRPQVLFPAYLSGLNLAEAFYAAMPSMSWQAVVVGDPLCAVGPRPEVPATSLEPETDPDTELPRFLSERRLKGHLRDDLQPEVVKLAMRANVRLAKGERAGAIADLEAATAINPRLPGAQVILAGEYEASGDIESAEQRYRAALEGNPKDVVALNNLAYLLSVRRNRPDEALPLAERAYDLSKGGATIADTLGWIHHMLGNNDRALSLVGAAARALPQHAEIRYHLAAVALAAGDRETARRELSEAIRLDASLAERDDVKELDRRLRER